MKEHSFIFKATELGARERAYTFDDVLLVPCRSAVQSRSDVSLETAFTRRHKIKLPAIAANMDTISEYEMCAAMSSIGAAAILHRFLTIEEQVAQVKKGILAASVGVNLDSKDRARALVDAGARILTVDIAH